MKAKPLRMSILMLSALLLIAGSTSREFSQQAAALRQVTPQAAPAPAADRRITLDVVVTDHSGNPVPGLQMQDFTVLDNKQPQPFTAFSASDGTKTPDVSQLRAIVLIDAVNTHFQAVGYERDQVEKLLGNDGGELALPTSLVRLTDESLGQTVVTRDGKTLVALLKSEPFGLRSHTRSQGYYGGAETRQDSISALGRLSTYEATQPGRKLLIWLGPGWPLLTGPGVQYSARSQDWIFSRLVRLSTVLCQARITLYNVDTPAGFGALAGQYYYQDFLKGVTSAKKVQNGNLALQVFAVQSGGQVIHASNEIDKSIASCLEDAKTYYTLSFDTPRSARADEYHSLQVKIGKPGLAARTRTGYYAQP